MRHPLLLLLIFCAASSFAADDARIALVVGCDYKGTGLQLPSPIRDAEAVAAALNTAGFAPSNIDLVRNPDRKSMLAAIEKFGAALSKSGGVGFFYFSGHGCQNEGINYLIPAGASLMYREDLPTEAVSAQRIVTRMDAAKNRINLLFLDACRTNELPSATTKSTLAKGLATMTGSNILIGFAAKENTPSFDSGDGSFYTNALAKEIPTPGIDVFTMLTNVRRKVKQATGDRQEPFLYAGLDEPFSFMPSAAPSPVTTGVSTARESVGDAATPAHSQSVLRPKLRTTTRFNADLSQTRPEKTQLISGVKSYVKPDPNARAGTEPGLNFKFRSVDTPAKLVFRAQSPDYPMIVSVRFPEVGRYCDLPDAFYESVKKATGFHLSELPASWLIQATMYDFADDGNPELVVALNEKDSDMLEVFVYSFHPPANEEDLSRVDNWQFAGHVSGQFIARLSEDELQLPYGTQGLFENYIYRSGYLVEGGNLAINKDLRSPSTPSTPRPGAQPRVLPEKLTASSESPVVSPLETKLRQLASQYIESSSSDSLEREMALYAEAVDYYGQGLKTNAFIRKDTQRQRATALQRQFEVLAVKDAFIDPAKDQGAITVDYKYAITSGGKRKEGTASSRLVFRSLSLDPKVIFVNEVKSK